MGFEVPSSIAERAVVVVGGGTLGRRIAVVFASGGAPVRVVDPAPEQSRAAVEYVTSTAPSLRAALDAPHGEEPGDALAFSDVEDAVPGAWLVVEAVPERLEIKRPLFATLDRIADPDALLATNSSSFASREVITDVEHPERVLNMHFAMPPRSMAVELMSDGCTDPAALNLLARELPAFGLLPFIAARESTGFIFNRIWAAIKRESLAVVAEGVSTPADVDAIMRANTGMAAGPFEMMDQVGLDVVLDIEDHYLRERPWLPTVSRDLVKSAVDAGLLGRKSGEGFFRYEV